MRVLVQMLTGKALVRVLQYTGKRTLNNEYMIELYPQEAGNPWRVVACSLSLLQGLASLAMIALQEWVPHQQDTYVAPWLMADRLVSPHGGSGRWRSRENSGGSDTLRLVRGTYYPPTLLVGRSKKAQS